VSSSSVDLSPNFRRLKKQLPLKSISFLLLRILSPLTSLKHLSADKPDKAAKWMRKLTDLEKDPGDARVCDPNLFAQALRQANVWKANLYEPGHWMKELLGDDVNVHVLNLGPKATPRQVRLICAGEVATRLYCSTLSKKVFLDFLRIWSTMSAI
jgi:hypothetical protein